MMRFAFTAGTVQFSFRGRAVDPFTTPERVSVVDAFRRHARIDLVAVLPPAGPVSFAAAARRVGMRISDDDTARDRGDRHGAPDASGLHRPDRGHLAEARIHGHHIERQQQCQGSRCIVVSAIRGMHTVPDVASVTLDMGC